MNEQQPPKYSELLWDKYKFEVFSDATQSKVWIIYCRHKANYDKLVSLEAKIELVKNLNKILNYESALVNTAGVDAQSELNQLAKELNLKT